MTEFITASVSYPGIVFTVLLGFVCLYWLTVVVGALDVDVLDASLPGLEADGPDGLVSNGLLGGLLGLGVVPLTVSLSIFALAAWTICLLGLQAFGPDAGTMARTLVGFVAALAGLAVTAVAVRPLRGAFVPRTAERSHRLVGKMCTITTLSVDEQFGQAEVATGGAPLLLQVRCSEPSGLTRGQSALIFDYDTEAQVFHVAPIDHRLASLPETSGDRK